MRNFFMNCFHFKWEYIFKFTCHEHACNPSNMKVSHLFSLFAAFEVSIEKAYSNEKSLIVAFKIC